MHFLNNEKKYLLYNIIIVYLFGYEIQAIFKVKRN